MICDVFESFLGDPVRCLIMGELISKSIWIGSPAAPDIGRGQQRGVRGRVDYKGSVNTIFMLRVRSRQEATAAPLNLT